MSSTTPWWQARAARLRAARRRLPGWWRSRRRRRRPNGPAALPPEVVSARDFDQSSDVRGRTRIRLPGPLTVAVAVVVVAAVSAGPVAAAVKQLQLAWTARTAAAEVAAGSLLGAGPVARDGLAVTVAPQDRPAVVVVAIDRDRDGAGDVGEACAVAVVGAPLTVPGTVADDGRCR